MLRFFSGSVRHSTAEAKSGQAAVHLIEPPHRSPETIIEQRLAARLKETGVVPLSTLVNAVAAELYRDELRRGAGVLDLALFGSRLFSADVVRELKAGNGILWEIQQGGTSHD